MVRFGYSNDKSVLSYGISSRAMEDLNIAPFSQKVVKVHYFALFFANFCLCDLIIQQSWYCMLHCGESTMEWYETYM